MLIGFKSQFAPLVEAYLNGDDNAKHQTVRAIRKEGYVPKVGETLYLYTGLRTKKSRKLGDDVCAEVLEIELEECWFTINGQIASYLQQQEIAIRDGFNCVANFLNWFQSNHGFPFHGHIIRWERKPKK